jgi:KUP system potassium uptake protein
LGRAFGPVMFVFFCTIAGGGLYALLKTNRFDLIVSALNPFVAARFLFTNPWSAWVGLGSVLLAVTGCEALYADVSIFGRFPIQITWFALVMPALLLCYCGQAAILLDPSSTVEELGNPFFALAPTIGLRSLLVVLATLATLIASQSVISGTFQVIEQAISLGFGELLNKCGLGVHGLIFICSACNFDACESSSTIYSCTLAALLADC